MLRNISINNFILIDSLDLDLGEGLSVLTGETGAGKSILLDAVSFALGAKGGAELIRSGQDSATVSLEFEIAGDSPTLKLLQENEIPAAATILIRRTVGANGRGKIFINDIPATAALAKQIGEYLIEIHGQFDSQSLLNPATHIDILDTFGELDRAPIKAAYSAWQSALKARESAEQSLKTAKEDEDYVRYNLEELKRVNPEQGEEAELDSKHRGAIAGGKIAGAISSAIAKFNANGYSPDKVLSESAAFVGKIPPDAKTPEILQLQELFEDAINKSADISAALDTLSGSMEFDEFSADKIEERLFKIRELARKHKIQPDDLHDYMVKLEAILNNIDNSDEFLKDLQKQETATRDAYVNRAKELSEKRKKSAVSLAKLVMEELPPLKLSKAVFEVEIVDGAESATGMDKVQFVGATNLGGKPGLIHKIASGGELARFTLAIKVVIQNGNSVGTMVFDEIDTGISGATAQAVGERLLRLGAQVQTLVITHSPQVAALGDNHFQVAKHFDESTMQTTTRLSRLKPMERIAEVARIISGDKITEEALAAAKQLFKD